MFDEAFKGSARIKVGTSIPRNGLVFIAVWCL